MHASDGVDCGNHALFIRIRIPIQIYTRKCGTWSAMRSSFHQRFHAYYWSNGWLPGPIRYLQNPGVVSAHSWVDLGHLQISRPPQMSAALAYNNNNDNDCITGPSYFGTSASGDSAYGPGSLFPGHYDGALLSYQGHSRCASLQRLRS